MGAEPVNRYLCVASDGTRPFRCEDDGVSEHGIRVYDLAGNWCEECGQPKLNRMHGALTGCPVCDEVITRHRCENLPPPDNLAAGSRWTCQDCGSAWVLVISTEACGDCCAECGHMVTVARWEVTADHRASGPRREPPGYRPMRVLVFPTYPHDTLEAEARDRREWIAGVAERLGLVRMKEQ